MIGAVRDWLMAIIAVSVVISVAQSLMPAGAVRQVGQLLCGLVLLCVLVRPLCALKNVSISRFLEEYTIHIRLREEELEREVGQSRKTVIEDYCASYILDKAEELGLTCRVEVDCVLSEDGLWLPERARLWGGFDDVTQSRLTQLLETDLGIPRGAQTYYLT